MNVNWYPEVLKKYATFEGRAGRAEFWVFILFNSVISFVTYVTALVSDSNIVLMLYYLYALAVLLPSVAVAVRRLHDTGKSGWYYLLVLVPFGAIVLIVFWAQEGQLGQNAYGAGAPPAPGEPAPPAPAAAPMAAWGAPVGPPAPPIWSAPPAVSSAASAPRTATPPFCTQCGASVRHGGAFCTSCGARTEA